jgi:predicted alpha/beta superfamily hydrolase
MLFVPRVLCRALAFVPLVLVYGASVAAQEVGKTTSFTFHSAILNEDRAFQIYVPSALGPKSRTIYVLDGQAQFMTVVDSLKSLGQTQHVVIGVGNIWSRERDYTPTRVPASALVDASAAAVSGGGEKFAVHLEKELVPYIDSRYPAGPSRILIGHSLGGLLGVSILLNHSGIFDKFVIIDPSMWWDDSRLVRESKDRLERSFTQTAIFLAIANSKNRDRDDIDAVRADTTQNTALIRPSVLLLDQFRAHPKNGIDLRWRYYKDQEHLTVFRPAVKDGLAFVFE